MNYRDIMVNLQCSQAKAYSYIHEIQAEAKQKGFNNVKVMGKKVTVKQFTDFFQLSPNEVEQIKFAEE